MRAQCIMALGIVLFPMAALAGDSVYCPERQGYIRVGMSESQVIGACGQPVSRATDVKINIKVPITQLIYTTLNQGAVYPGLTSQYNMWSLPSGSTGTSLKVSIVDGKVFGVAINGSDTNGMSICGGISVQIGDDVNKVYAACGSPSLVNNTYINQPVGKSSNPEIWVYQQNQYESPISLTFINGKLQSIQ